MDQHPISPELAARATAAAALLADYKRAAPTEDVAGRAMWGARLADALESVLGGLDAAAAARPRRLPIPPADSPGTIHPGGGWISGSSRS
jgi:hypothetical protein